MYLICANLEQSKGQRYKGRDRRMRGLVLDSRPSPTTCSAYRVLGTCLGNESEYTAAILSTEPSSTDSHLANCCKLAA